MKLLTVGNPKTAKGQGLGYLTAILHLAPADTAGAGNVCPYSTAGCRATCLNTAGRGGIFRKGETTNTIQEARKRKTRAFFADRPSFLAELVRDLRAFARKAARAGLKPALRLNGTSDLDWRKLAPEVFATAADCGVQVYDYTKSAQRAYRFAGSRTWDITLSMHENMSNHEVVQALDAGINVAVVFAKGIDTPRRQLLASERWGASIIDGDAHDLRFLDPKGGRGVVVALTAKGRAKADVSGFVIR